MESLPPLVSIIIPTYNTAKYLPNTIESILQQDYQAIEIIVVDDGSTDDTVTVLRKYLTRINYIHQGNSGESKARNTGIKSSKGDFLMFVDADDLLPEKAVYTLLNKMLSLGSDYCLIHGEMEYFDDLTNEVLGYSSFKKISTNRKKLFASMQNLILASLVRRKAIEEVGMFDEDLQYGVATNIILKLAKIGKFYNIEECVYKYRNRTNSLSKRTDEYEKFLVFIQQRRNSLRKVLKGENLFIQAEAWSAYYSGISIKMHRFNRNQARRFAISAFLFNPYKGLKILIASFLNKLG
ncbi:MAG: glycosyltransferase family 2 protein [Coleofasciculus sp. G1-WW12-02]|uniref:glycosyltransferase family 2 protein n=1 Tax=Coleofasciculus sp. G1-WW12-02 TaxID=3068483 RepID=UPI0032FF1FEC